MARKLWIPLAELHDTRMRAAICRRIEDGTLLLVPDLDHQSGTPVEGFEPALRLGRDSALIGGLLAPEAVRAEALDRSGRPHAAVCANGVWIASVPEPSRFGDALVRFRDAAGKIVQRPLRAGTTVTMPSTEVSRPCPPCAARDWQIARWPWFADEFVRTDVYDVAAGVCRRCGHTEQLGAERDGGKPHSDKPHATEPPSIEELVRAAQFPIFGLAPTWRGRRCLQLWEERASGGSRWPVRWSRTDSKDRASRHERRRVT